MGGGLFISVFQLVASLGDSPPARPYFPSEYVLIVFFSLMTPGLNILTNILSLPGMAAILFLATWASDGLGWRPSIVSRIAAGLVVSLAPAVLDWAPVLLTGREASPGGARFFSLFPFSGGSTLGAYQLSLGLGSVAASGLLAGLVYRACETGWVARLLQPKPSAPQP